MFNKNSLMISYPSKKVFSNILRKKLNKLKKNHLTQYKEFQCF